MLCTERLISSRILCTISLPASDLTFAIAVTASDRKSTRLNSSHVSISYAVFCLKKKMRLALQQDDLSSYEQAADFLNFNNFDLVCLHHEHAILGEPAGNDIFSLVRRFKIAGITD